MRGFFVCVLFLSALVCFGLAAPKVNNICDTCQCMPSVSAEQAKEVRCNCNATMRVITTTVDNMKELPHLESFTVVDCDSVHFKQKSFANKHDLSNVILKQVKTAIFPVGVFAKLDSLKIEDVDDLQLKAMAFLGAEIGEIAIRNTTIHEIPELALYNVKLRKLELADLKIGTIKSNSTLFVMGEQSNLNIDRCQVEHVENKGLQLKAQNLRISGSTLKRLAPSSIIIDAAIGIDILQSTFGKSEADGMQISSKKINIFNNTFFSIPIALANKVEGAQVIITHNLFHDVNINPSILEFISAEFLQNSFQCNCDFAEILRFVELSVSLATPNFGDFSSNNYCQSNCTNKRSVKDFFDQVKVSCLKEDLDLCAPEAPEHEEGSDSSAAVSARSGRRDDHHEPSVTTEGHNALTSGNAKYGANSLLFMAALTPILVIARPTHA